MIIRADFFNGKMILLTDDGLMVEYDENETIDDGLTGQQSITKSLRSNNWNPDKDFKKLTNVAVGYSADGPVTLSIGVEDSDYSVTLPAGNNQFKNIATKLSSKSRGRRFYYQIDTNAENIELFDIDLKLMEVPQKRMFNNG